MVKQLTGILFGGSERTRTVKKNAVASLAIRIVAMVIQLVQVPVVLSYLDSTLYGVYLTITSIVMWTHNFDFGLGSGLRYKLTESISKRDTSRSKTLVSTAYVSLAAIMIVIGLLCLPLLKLLDWPTILNCHSLSENYLCLCVFVVLITILAQFVLELITIVLQANQQTALSSIFKPIANLVSIGVVLILKATGAASLFYACLALTVPLLLTLLVVNVWLFAGRLRSIAPSLSSYRKDALSDIYSLGLKFFVGSLASMVVFNSANLLLSYYINPAEVSVYSTSSTYFATIVVFHGVFLAPIWVSITDAYVKEDFAWIRRCMKKLYLLTTAFSILCILALLVSQFVFRIWLGDKLTIPVALCVFWTLYYICNIWSASLQSFVTGVGKAQLTMYLSIVKILIFIPVAILLIKAFGVVGMVLAIILVNTLPNVILGYVQYRLIINGRARGVWNK